MNDKSRIINSTRNLVNGLISQVISLILSFVVRTFFIRYLGKEYLGVNGLFANILTVFSLAELGFGTAMIHSMYKPLAQRDTKKIQALMNLYSKVYKTIGLCIAILGISIIPFMSYIIKGDNQIENLNFIYIMFLTDSVLSYFFAYKRSILSADQKEYVSYQYRFKFTIIKSIIQICVLMTLKRYVLYLFIQILMTFVENMLISYKVNELYPFLKIKNNETLSKYEIIKIKNDVKALVLTKFGHVMLEGTDNIIISSVIGISWVAMLSNYTLIIGSVVMVLSQVFTSITGSVGNYIAKENKLNQYKLFKNIDFINFWMYGFAAICLAALLNPFIELWLGNEYILDTKIVNILSINFFISGIMKTLWIFRSTMGLFTQGKYRPIITAILNILISIVLAKYIGVLGVLLGTTISRVVINLWFDPYIIYNYGLGKNVKEYYLTYIFRVALMIIIYMCISYIKKFLYYDGIININKLFTLAGFCMIIINIIFIIIYNKTDQFQYIKKVLYSIKNKRKSFAN